MTQTTDRRSGRDDEREWLRGAVTVVLAGIVLGAAYNYLGLQGRRPWGLGWIATERVADMPVVAADNGSPDPPAHVTTSDDPLAIPASAAGLPPIPDVGRPVQIETGALKQYVDAGAALIIDAREPQEYREGHIPGAVNLPYDEIITDPARLEALDTSGRPIVTYCGGGTCELSLSLAHELIYAGHSAVAVYLGGFPEWLAAGHPVQQGS